MQPDNPDSHDYFSVLGLPRSFDIDLAELEKRYFAVQKAFHPDRMVGRSANERRLAISQSMFINSAYETLKSPLKLANYLLSINGINPSDAKPSNELLIEVMEIREQLAEAQTTQEINELEATSTKKKENLIIRLSGCFRSNELVSASELSIHLGYISKILDEIRIKKKIFLPV